MAARIDPSTSRPRAAAEEHAKARGRLHLPSLAVFVVIAFALPWLLALPLYLGGGLDSPLTAPLSLTTMVTPAIAAVVATLLVLRPAHPGRFLGLVPLRPARRLVGFLLLGLLAPPILAIVALLIASAFGAARLTTGIDGGDLIALISMPVLSLAAAVPAFGEELGWRGFLLPALRPLGVWPALLVSGVAWGLWHAPLVLLGYNYGRIGVLGLVLMIVFSTLAAIPVGWLRMRSASVWPATVAHGAIDATGGVVLGVFAFDPAGAFAGSLLGWAGWIVLALTAVGIAIASHYRWVSPRTAAARTS